jgi:prepilin-type N-terminal cleavage/methylation domain-containing protein
MRGLAMRLVRPARSGASLIELLVVLAIMGVMMSLLLPALNSARERANEMVCKNNLHQLSLAMHNFRSAHKRLPGPNLWTVELLPFLEEQALADALWGADPTTVEAAKVPPAVFSCTSQPELDSTVSGTPICHYVLVIDAPFEWRNEKITWKIADRQADLPSAELPPWYVGPEILPFNFQQLINNDAGPHRGGVFFPE